MKTKTKTKTKWEIVHHLNALSNGDILPTTPECGICEELTHTFHISGTKLVKQYSPSWPEYNGNSLYPVDHPTKVEDEAYTELSNLWDDTPYGDTRRRLCSHIALELEKEIAAQEANWYISATTILMGIVLGSAAVGVIAILEYLRWGIV